jgi:hypothetical protein
MDSNYEAQRHLTRERLASRREQAAAERLLRQEGRGSGSGPRYFLVRLFQGLGQRDEQRGGRQAPTAAQGQTEKGKFA